MKDLNTLIDPSDPLARYVTLFDAHGVNDDGWIIANGVNALTRQTRPYLLSCSHKDLPAV